MPGAPSSFLLLVVRPGAPSSVLAHIDFNDCKSDLQDRLNTLKQIREAKKEVPELSWKPGCVFVH